MEKRPEFIIVAGPNGAGKSRLGPFYSKVKAFDGDWLAMKIRKEHPDWKPSWIDGTVMGTLMKETDEAINLRRDYAFETNFSSELPLLLIENFKKANYKISLVYFGLPSIMDSIQRVEQRQIMGGHDVSLDVIEYNFKEGVKKLCEALHLFDNLLFVDGASDFGDVIAIHVNKSNRHDVTDHTAPWFDRFFRKAFDELVSSSNNEA